MVSLFFFVGVSVLLYLTPLVIVLALRARPARTREEIVFDLVSVVAFDLFSLLLLSFLVPLGLAAVLARGLWLGFGGVLLFRRRFAVLEAWRATRLETWRLPFATAFLALLLSFTLSLPSALWDRHWHIPLVSALGGQRLPFFNVYEPAGKLYYHYSGDALAAVFQALSFAHMHASQALSRTHDVLFGLVGFTLGLFLQRLGVTRVISALGIVAACLLAGPATMFVPGSARPAHGYSILNLLSLSFRPHVPLAFLFLTGFMAAALLPLFCRERPVFWPRARMLIAASMGLALTDEASLMVGLAVGAMWLLWPQILHERMRIGAALLGCMLVGVGVVPMVFGGTFSAGAQRHAVTIIPGMLPGFYAPLVPLWLPEGLRLALTDLWMVPLIWLLGLWSLLRARGLAELVSFIGYSMLVLTSLGGLFSITREGDGLEAHRFVTALLFVAPLFGAAWLSHTTGPRSPSTRSVATVLLFVAVTPPAASTIGWLRTQAPDTSFWGTDHFYSTDCRQIAAAKLTDITRPTYAEAEVFYLVSGCRPIFSPGPDEGPYGFQMLIGFPTLGVAGLKKMRSWVPKEQMVPSFCSVSPTDDRVCNALRADNACQPLSPKLLACELSPSLRRKLTKKKGRRVSTLTE